MWVGVSHGGSRLRSAGPSGLAASHGAPIPPQHRPNRASPEAVQRCCTPPRHPAVCSPCCPRRVLVQGWEGGEEGEREGVCAYRHLLLQDGAVAAAPMIIVHAVLVSHLTRGRYRPYSRRRHVQGAGFCAGGLRQGLVPQDAGSWSETD